MSRNIKILHLLTSDVFSGAENVVCQIINNFSDMNKYNMAYCSLDGSVREVLLDKKIEFLPVNKFSYIQVKKVIDKYKPDIIHAHDIKASVMASLFSYKYKIISHLHGNHDDMKKINIKTLLYYCTHKRYSSIIVVSKSIKDDFVIKKTLKDSVLLYNVLNRQEIINRKMQDRTEYNFDIIFLGRLNHIKNPIRIIDIFYRAWSKNKDIKMAIVGDGELREELICKINELKLNNNIEMLGYMKNPYKVLSNSKLLIMASKYEGTPMSVLEAMALGIPIISTPTDGVKEIIENYVDGYLSNDDETLSEKINELINDPKKWKSLSLNSINKFNKINNLDEYKKKLIEIYNK